MMSKEIKYNLSIPSPLYESLKHIADKRGVEVIDVIQQFFRLGLLIDKAQESNDLAVDDIVNVYLSEL